MRVVIIANPIAGRGAATRRVEALGRCLEQKGAQVCTHRTEGPGDATRLGRQIGHDADCLVIAGGDGTIHEAVNGLRDPSATPIAILRVGTANILARDLDMPSAPPAVADMILGGKTRRIDMGITGTGRRFLMVASAGFDAMVIKAIHQRRRGKLGFLGYPLPILRTMFRYRAPALQVRVDDGPPMGGALVVVANTFTYAGILSVCSRARCDSGRLEVVVFERASIPSLARYALAGWRHQMERVAGARHRSGRRIQIEADDPVDVEIDGEYHGTTPVHIELMPSTVPLLVPE